MKNLTDEFKAFLNAEDNTELAQDLISLQIVNSRIELILDCDKLVNYQFIEWKIMQDLNAFQEYVASKHQKLRYQKIAKRCGRILNIDEDLLKFDEMYESLNYYLSIEIKGA